MKIYKIETDNILFTGDIHGNFNIIASTIKGHDLDNCAVIVCGDIGLGFEKEAYYTQVFNRLTKTLKPRNVHVYMFRGNHDSKAYFDGEHFTEFDYIHVIPDYSIIQTPTRNILCVGGATSIDRKIRQERMYLDAIGYARFHGCDMETATQNAPKLYWEDEQCVYDENELSQLEELNIKIDTVCTHTCPSFCFPITKDGVQGWMERDEKLSDDLDIERKACDDILNYLKSHIHPITNWYYGHFHTHKVEIIDGIKYTLLDMSRTKLDLV